MTEITSHKTPISVKVGTRVYKDKIRYWVRHYYGIKPDGNPDRYFEYLDLVGYANPKNQEQRAKNKQNLKFAQQLADDYMAQVRANKYNRTDQKLRGLWLIEHITEWAEKTYSKGSSIGAYQSIVKHLRIYLNGRDIKLSQVDKNFCNGFWTHLQTAESTMKGTLDDASSKTYMKKFKYYLEQLVNADLFLQSPARHIKVGVGKSKGKDFINREQLEILENHPTKWEVVKRYYLFASYSAITLAECIKMKFGDFDQDDNGQWYANVVRQKSQKPARLRMSEKAMSFILPMGNPNDLVFPNLKAGSNLNQYLLEWVQDAGIDKHLTPHTAKNNFAVMFWRKNKGNHIGALMGLLQHENLDSTTRYLKKMLSTEYLSSNANIDF